MADATKPCPYCGETILAVAKKCRHCRRYLDPALQRENALTPSAADRMLSPVGRPGSAIAAGYLGLLSFVPFLGVVFGLLAVAYGMRALKAIKREPELFGKGRAWFGIVTGAPLALLWGVAVIMAFVGAAAGGH